MPETHDFGRRDRHGKRDRYWHIFRYPRLTAQCRRPWFTEAARTREIEWPYRGGYGRAYRLFPTRWLLVVGQWRDNAPRSEEDADVLILEALDAPLLDVDVDDIAEWA